MEMKHKTLAKQKKSNKIYLKASLEHEHFLAIYLYKRRNHYLGSWRMYIKAKNKFSVSNSRSTGK